MRRRPNSQRRESNVVENVLGTLIGEQSEGRGSTGVRGRGPAPGSPAAGPEPGTARELLGRLEGAPDAGRGRGAGISGGSNEAQQAPAVVPVPGLQEQDSPQPAPAQPAPAQPAPAQPATPPSNQRGPGVGSGGGSQGGNQSVASQNQQTQGGTRATQASQQVQRPSPAEQTQQQAQALGIGRNTGPGITEASEIEPVQTPTARANNAIPNTFFQQQQESLGRLRSLQQQLQEAPTGFNAEAMQQRIAISNALDAEAEALGLTTQGASSGFQANTQFDSGVTQQGIQANAGIRETEATAQSALDRARIQAATRRDTARDQALTQLQGANIRRDGRVASERIAAEPGPFEQRQLQIFDSLVEEGLDAGTAFNLASGEVLGEQNLIRDEQTGTPIGFRDRTGQLQPIQQLPSLLNNFEAGRGGSTGIGVGNQ